MDKKYFLITSPEYGVVKVEWERFEEVVKGLGQGQIDYLVSENKELNIQLGGLSIKGKEAFSNPYSQRVGMISYGTVLIFKLVDRNPYPLDEHESETLITALDPDRLLNIATDGYLLLSPVDRNYLVLPSRDIQDYLDFYFKNPLPLELKDLSKDLGFQITLWINNSKIKEDYKVYNWNASNLLSHQMNKPVKLRGTAILSTRNMTSDLIATYGDIPLAFLRNLARKLDMLQDFPGANRICISKYLNSGKEV